MTDSTPRRVALVTGASRGIGRAIAVALGSAGYDVAINYRANTVAAQEATRLVEQSGTRATAIQAHVGNPDQRF